MSVRTLTPYIRMVDANGMVTREWYLFFQSLFSNGSASGSSNEVSLQPLSSASDVTYALMGHFSDDMGQAPPSQTFNAAADDVSPQVAALQAEVAMLRKRLDEIAQGNAVL